MGQMTWLLIARQEGDLIMSLNTYLLRRVFDEYYL